MDHVFTLVADGGFNAILGRMKATEPTENLEHNFALFAASAAKHGMSVVWSRGELCDRNAMGGWDMTRVVKVS